MRGERESLRKKREEEQGNWGFQREAALTHSGPGDGAGGLVLRRSSGGGSSGCGNGGAVAALTEIPAPCRSLAQILIACKRSDTHSHSPTALDTHQAGPEGRRSEGDGAQGWRLGCSKLGEGPNRKRVLVTLRRGGMKVMDNLQTKGMEMEK